MTLPTLDPDVKFRFKSKQCRSRRGSGSPTPGFWPGCLTSFRTVESLSVGDKPLLWLAPVPQPFPFPITRCQGTFSFWTVPLSSSSGPRLPLHSAAISLSLHSATEILKVGRGGLLGWNFCSLISPKVPACALGWVGRC